MMWFLGFLFYLFSFSVSIFGGISRMSRRYGSKSNSSSLYSIVRYINNFLFI